jgi:hypothetical protein
MNSKALFILGSLALCGVAQADTVGYVITGTVESGYTDGLGLFGGGNIGGDTITYTFTYDPSLLQNYAPYYVNGPGLIFDQGHTGEMSVSINGYTYSVANNAGDGLYLTDCNSCQQSFPTVIYGGLNSPNALGGQTISVFFVNGVSVTPPDLTNQSAVTSFLRNDNYQTYVSVGTIGGSQEPISFTTNSVEATTPEPATWGSILLGLGAVTFLKRRRTAK